MYGAFKDSNAKVQLNVFRVDVQDGLNNTGMTMDQNNIDGNSFIDNSQAQI